MQDGEIHIPTHRQHNSLLHLRVLLREMSMKSLEYTSVQKSLVLLTWGLLVSAFMGCVLIAATEKDLTWQWDRDGLVHFFSIYDIPMKLLGAAFATFVLWVTLGRVIQTERQIDAMTDNNKFNNYYKHMDEFLKFLSSISLISEYCKRQGVDPRMVFVPAYKSYYYDNYRLFEPRINGGARRTIDKFTETVKTSPLNQPQTQLESISSAELLPISRMADEVISAIVSSMTSGYIPSVQQFLRSAGLNVGPIETEVERFELIQLIYWVNSFYRSLMAFDGTAEEPTEQFAENYRNYEHFVGLQ
jgi:hypothetical protein